MKKFLIFVSAIIFSINVSAQTQVKALYFRGNKITSDSTIATSYGVYGIVGPDKLCILKTYNLYDELTSTGSYKDETLKVEHGDFVYYNDYRDFNYQNNTSFFLKDKTRYVSLKGRFEDGLRTGKWTTFYPTGNILMITTYLEGQKNGLFGYYENNGDVIQTGNYVMDKKDGEWFYNKGRRKEVYIMGVLQKEEKKKKQSKASGTVN